MWLMAGLETESKIALERKETGEAIPTATHHISTMRDPNMTVQTLSDIDRDRKPMWLMVGHETGIVNNF